MFKNFKTITKLCFASALLLGLGSCDKEDPKIEKDQSSLRPYHLVLGQGSTAESVTYVQSASMETMADKSKTFNFNGFGFEVPSTRTARVYTSKDGNTLYNLNYGGGAVSKFEYNGGQEYKMLLNTDVQAAVGTANPRWTKIDDNTALLHHVVTERIYENDIYKRTSSKVILVLVNLNNMTLGTRSEFEFPWTEEEASQGIFVFRIDAPVVANGKVYYGAGKQKYDPATNANVTMVYSDAETLVLDYPSLTNPTTIRTNVGGVKGATNGYRTPVAHIDENGDIYQITSSAGLSILKIKDGAYDTSYGRFDIGSALGHTAQANGWFYVGDGIGYIPVLNADAGNNASSNWHVVRVDLKNKTAVKMNIPFPMWLHQYQWASVIEGKLYMALTPLSGKGNVYIFDPKSTSPDGFEVGATLETGTDAFYLGIF